MTTLALPQRRFSITQSTNVNENGRHSARKYVVKDTLSDHRLIYTTYAKAIAIRDALNAGVKKIGYGGRVISAKSRVTGRPRKDEEARLVEGRYQERLIEAMDNLGNPKLSVPAVRLVEIAKANGTHWSTAQDPAEGTVQSLKNILNMWDLDEVNAPDQRVLDYIMDALDIWFEEQGV